MKILLTLMMIICSSTAFAHGTGYREVNITPPALEFSYSTGEAMSYREARVFSPADSKFAYQTGRTDEFGRFAFVPNTSGDWRVIVRDEEGHQCEAVINVNSDFHAEIEEKDSTPLYLRAILGVSLIFNLAAFIKLWSKAHAH